MMPALELAGLWPKKLSSYSLFPIWLATCNSVGPEPMRHKSFGNMQCPIARSLERVGEWWSILILRDAAHGLSRFDEFLQSLGIAPNILARRLKVLVEAGLLERRRYSERP